MVVRLIYEIGEKSPIYDLYNQHLNLKEQCIKNIGVYLKKYKISTYSYNADCSLNSVFHPDKEKIQNLSYRERQVKKSTLQLSIPHTKSYKCDNWYEFKPDKTKNGFQLKKLWKEFGDNNIEALENKALSKLVERHIKNGAPYFFHEHTTARNGTRIYGAQLYMPQDKLFAIIPINPFSEQPRARIFLPPANHCKTVSTQEFCKYVHKLKEEDESRTKTNKQEV